MKKNIVSAGFIVIGNEILSGRTRDENINFLAKNLVEIGIVLKEVRIIGDFEDEIIATIREIKNKYDYIFTSGGIGPTHDDITSASIAKALNKKLILNKNAEEILYKHYGKDNVNDARLKMAYLPESATLLNNPISSAPGFRIENIFVMAGIPKIFNAMFNVCIADLVIGDKILNREIKINLTESLIAKDLTNLQHEFPEISMGSYPFEQGTSLVFRGYDLQKINDAIKKMSNILININSKSIIEIN